MADATGNAPRNRALIVLSVTVLLAVVAWLLLQRATDAGLHRLELLDGVRAQCDSLRARARSADESLRVVMTALKDTIDPKSNDALRSCGDLAKAK